jgi:fumarate hydratase class II
MVVTSLAPAVGYEEAAALAKEAHKTGQTIRELCLEKNVLPAAELDRLLDPDAMTRPSA